MPHFEVSSDSKTGFISGVKFLPKNSVIFFFLGPKKVLFKDGCGKKVVYEN